MSARLPFLSFVTCSLTVSRTDLRTVATIIGPGAVVARLPLAFAVLFPAPAGTRQLRRSTVPQA